MVSDSTTVRPSEPGLCAKGCGFFGSVFIDGLWLCSKCYLQHIQITSATAALDLFSINDKISAPTVAAVSSPAVVPTVADTVPPPERCQECKKRVKIGRGFSCRCGFLFCTSHRYPEEHRCSFDYKMMAEQEITKANPMVKADRIQRI